MVLASFPSGRNVAPHWGAWIEMLVMAYDSKGNAVAPHWGAWIEIEIKPPCGHCLRVAPHWGAWIEIFSESNTSTRTARRTPLGCVD